MPKDTFYNLSAEKKQRITDVAIDEFFTFSYHKASISRITKNAEIAKGSFYQYFEDKDDLFRFLFMEVIAEKKIKYLSSITKNASELPFFELLREIYRGSIRFAKENPKLSMISNDFLKNSNSNLKNRILGDSISKSNQILESLLKTGIEKGEINPRIDIQFVAFILSSLSITIGEYFIKEAKVNDDMEIMVLLNKMILVLEDGLKERGKKNDVL